MDRIDEDKFRFKTTEINLSQQSNTFTTPISMYLAAGTVIDSRYKIESILGEGGCGCVYKALHVSLHKYCALKTLNPINVNENTMLRLHKEARAAGLLEHDNLVRATDFGLINNSQPFLVMDLVDGPTLADYLKEKGTLSVETAISMFVPICSGLAYAHQQGVIHRDIKPSNILLARADNDLGFIPKVSDFGIAKLQIGGDNSQTLTATGEIFGTPLYMSPEQCLGTGVDQRSDIYSLGCVLFEALTGDPPFIGSNPMELMMKHTNEPAPSLKEASLGREFPAALETIVANMLNKDPRDRYQKLDDAWKDLVALRAGRTPAPLKRQAPDSGSSKTLAIALACAMVSLVIGGVAYYVGIRSVPIYQTKSASVKEPGSPKVDVTPISDSYSQIVGDRRKFTFPNEEGIGTLHYWGSGPENIEHPCQGIFDVPKTAKLILYSKERMAATPSMWVKFRDSDLVGIRADFSDQDLEAIDSPDSPADVVLKSILPREHLRLLALPNVSFKNQTWKMLGDMTGLRWLWLSVCTINNRPISGQDVAKLQNLSNLKVLSLDQILDVKPLLRSIKSSNALVRLSLGQCTFDKEDGKLLAQIPNLKMLRIRSSTITDSGFFDELAAAPHLQALCLNCMNAQDPNIAKHLTKFRRLKQLAVDSKQPLLDKVQIPGCEVTVFKAVGLSEKDIKNGILSGIGVNGKKSKIGDIDSIAKRVSDHFLGDAKYPDYKPTDSMAPEIPANHNTCSWFNFFRINPDTDQLW